MNISLGKLFVEIGATFKAFSDAMKNVEQRMVQVGDSLQSAGQKLSVSLTAPLLAIGGGAIKAAIDFEAAFANVRKNVDGSREDLADLEQGIRSMAMAMPATAEEIAAVASTAGQLGIATDQILAFSEAMIKVGETTSLSAEAAATSLAQIVAVTKLPQSEIPKLASVLLLLGKTSETTETKIVEMAQRIAGAGAQIGLADHQILAFATALSSVGIEAEAGGTAISRVFAEIAKNVAQGGEGLERFAEIAGMAADTFVKEFKTNAASAVNAFIIGLGRIKQAGGDVFSTLESVEFADARVRNALLSLAGAGDRLTETLQKAKGELRDNTTLNDTYAERLNTVKAAMETLWNRMKEVATVVGEALMPGVKALATTLSGFVVIADAMARIFRELPTPLRAAVFIFGAMTAVVGPLLFVLGSLVKTFAAVRTAILATMPVMTALHAHPLVAIASALAIVVTLFGAFALGAIRATGPTESFGKAVSKAAEDVRKLREERDKLVSQGTELERQLARAKGALEFSRTSGLGKFSVELEPMRLAEIKALENEIAKLQEQLRQIDVDSAFARWGESVEIAGKRLRTTNDYNRYLNDQIQAHKDLIEDLIPLLDENDERLKSVVHDLQTWTSAQDAHNKEQESTQETVKGSNDLMRKYQVALKALAIEFAVTGDVQRKLSDEFQIVESALKDYAAAAAAAGVSMDALADDAQFQQLLARWRELRDLVGKTNEEIKKGPTEFQRWIQELGPSLEDLQKQFAGFSDGFASAFGRGVGDALVLQKSFRDSFRTLWIDLLAQTVSNLATMGAQWALHYAYVSILEWASVAEHGAAEGTKTATTTSSVIADIAIATWGAIQKAAIYAWELGVWIATKGEQLVISAATAAAEVVTWTIATAEKIGLYAAELVFWIATKADQLAVSIATASAEIATWLVVHFEKLAMWAVELARVITLFATYIYMAIVAAWSSLGPFGFVVGLALAAGVVAGVLAAVGAFALGGIVTGPMLGLVGEAGPEAIIPLNRLDKMTGGIGSDRDQTIILIMDGRETARVVVPHIPGVVRSYIGGAL